MNEEMKTALAEMQKGLIGKSKEQVEAAVKAFTEKFNEEVETQIKGLVGEEVKTVKETLEGERKEALDAMQKHLDTMDVRIKGKKSSSGTTDAGDEIKDGIKANFEQISKVKKGRNAGFEIKAVGNMVLANITGDAERDFSNVVAKVPNQKVVFSDLIGTIPIDGGT